MGMLLGLYIKKMGKIFLYIKIMENPVMLSSWPVETEHKLILIIK